MSLLVLVLALVLQWNQRKNMQTEPKFPLRIHPIVAAHQQKR